MDRTAETQVLFIQTNHTKWIIIIGREGTKCSLLTGTVYAGKRMGSRVFGVMAKYTHNQNEVEEYIDLVPILEDLYYDADEFLAPIKKVRIKYN